LREQFLPRLQAWKQIVLGAVREALLRYQPTLPEGFDAEVISSLISEFWLGLEFARLIGDADERARHDKALDAIQGLLEALEARASKPATARRKSFKGER
jgi:hypothetical protein